MTKTLHDRMAQSVRRACDAFIDQQLGLHNTRALFARRGLSESLEMYMLRVNLANPFRAAMAGYNQLREWWRADGRAALGGAPPFAVNVCRVCHGSGGDGGQAPCGRWEFQCTACEGRGDFGRAEIVEDCTREEWAAAGMRFRDREAEERQAERAWERACGELPVLPPNRNRRAQRKARRLMAVRP